VSRGDCLQTLEDYSDCGQSIASLHESTRLASVLKNRAVNICGKSVKRSCIPPQEALLYHRINIKTSKSLQTYIVQVKTSSPPTTTINTATNHHFPLRVLIYQFTMKVTLALLASFIATASAVTARQCSVSHDDNGNTFTVFWNNISSDRIDNICASKSI
jgi:hypothetical protein